MYFKKHKSTVKEFTNFSSLSIKDLEKIEVYYYQNLEAIKKREIELIDIENKNKQIRINYELQKKKYLEYRNNNIKPITDYIKKAKVFLKQNKVNYLSLSNLIGNSVKWERDNYRNSKEVNDVISEIQKQQVLLRQYEEINPFKDYIELQEIKNNLPSLEKKLFKFGGVSHYVFFKTIDIDFIKSCIKKILDKEIERKKTLDELKARGASNESETRKIAESFKRKYPLNRQLNKLSDCPYCNKMLEKSNAHLEHIYPVSKGGKSSSRNLVWICSSCNRKKSNKTLTTFIKTHGMNRESIELNLDFLEKEY
jgi:5-methylcytosine-specific restriction endonuclease McrA